MHYPANRALFPPKNKPNNAGEGKKKWAILIQIMTTKSCFSKTLNSIMQQKHHYHHHKVINRQTATLNYNSTAFTSFIVRRTESKTKIKRNEKFWVYKTIKYYAWKYFIMLIWNLKVTHFTFLCFFGCCYTRFSNFEFGILATKTKHTQKKSRKIERKAMNKIWITNEEKIRQQKEMNR